MASSSTSFVADDFGDFVDSSSENSHVDVDLPEFDVLSRRHWVEKIVEMRNACGIIIADGILRNLRSSDVSGRTTPLGETHAAI